MERTFNIDYDKYFSNSILKYTYFQVITLNSEHVNPMIRKSGCTASQRKSGQSSCGAGDSVVNGGGAAMGEKSAENVVENNGNGGSGLRKSRKCVDVHSVDLIPSKSCKFSVNSSSQN